MMGVNHGGSTAQWYAPNSTCRPNKPASTLGVAEIHQPANTEQSDNEAAEYVESVTQALAVGALAHHAQDHGSEQREQEGCLEVRKVHLHQLFLPPAIS